MANDEQKAVKTTAFDINSWHRAGSGLAGGWFGIGEWTVDEWGAGGVRAAGGWRGDGWLLVRLWMADGDGMGLAWSGDGRLMESRWVFEGGMRVLVCFVVVTWGIRMGMRRWRVVVGSLRCGRGG